MGRGDGMVVPSLGTEATKWNITCAIMDDGLSKGEWE